MRPIFEFLKMDSQSPGNFFYCLAVIGYLPARQLVLETFEYI